jgi:hypothetical protein
LLAVGDQEEEFEAIPLFLPSEVRVEKEAVEGAVLSVAVDTKLEGAALSLVVNPHLEGVLLLSQVPKRSMLARRRLGLGGEDGIAMTAVGSVMVSCSPTGLTEVDRVAAFFLLAWPAQKGIQLPLRALCGGMFALFRKALGTRRAGQASRPMAGNLTVGRPAWRAGGSETSEALRPVLVTATITGRV